MSKERKRIFLEPEVLEQASAIARELKISRSGAISLAVRELSRRLRDQRLVEQINAVYGDEPDSDEQTRLKAIKRLYRRAATG